MTFTRVTLHLMYNGTSLNIYTSWSFSPHSPMSTLAQIGVDNKLTTGVVVALLFPKKMFIILLKLQLVSLLFFLPVSFLLNRYAELHEDIGETLRASMVQAKSDDLITFTGTGQLLL